MAVYFPEHLTIDTIRYCLLTFILDNIKNIIALPIETIFGNYA